jgi:hypothetical protein
MRNTSPEQDYQLATAGAATESFAQGIVKVDEFSAW